MASSSPSAPPPTTQPHPSYPPPNPKTNPTTRPFPAITGSCVCTAIRYRLLTAPLFVYACHCSDCQKTTGSAFGLYLNIEAHYIHVLSKERPRVAVRASKASLLGQIATTASPAGTGAPATTGSDGGGGVGPTGPEESTPGAVHRYVECPRCTTELWTTGLWSEGVCDVRVGTLDFPSLMEPDVHSYVESKVDWIQLPPGARSVPRGFGRDMWPKSSLKRLEVVKKRIAVAKAAAEERARRGDADEGDAEGEKTPTAVDGGGEEDDEAFEKRYKETERKLQERLEKLTLKLESEEKVAEPEEKKEGDGKADSAT